MNTPVGSAPTEESAPLRRLGQLIRFESGLLRRAIFLQAMQALSYIPFYAAVGIFIDNILRNESLSNEDRHFWIIIYALANLAVWDLEHPAFWPSDDPLRALACGDTTQALFALYVAGKAIGTPGDFVRSIVTTGAYREARREAQARLSSLMG